MLRRALGALASFSLKKPKTLLAIVAGTAVLGFWAHYKFVLVDLRALRAENVALSDDLDVANANVSVMRRALESERVAAAALAVDRDNARAAIDALRQGREQDLDAQEWAARPLPAGEQERLCTALPELGGC